MSKQGRGMQHKDHGDVGRSLVPRRRTIAPKVYKVWALVRPDTMKLVGETPSLATVRELVAPWRDAYVYVLRWENGESKHVWGCLNSSPYTNDLREDVRRILRQ